MRLLNTETLELKEFFGKPEDPYTILSHTWGDTEISLQEFQAAQDAINDGTTSYHVAIADKSGYRKIKDCCRRSQDDGYCWTWVDTCCIDKTNSAELSEAINSMFQWYQNAAVCYVLLDDVQEDKSLEAHHLDALQRSRWFTRGWTLQELIAPTRLFMFDAAWQLLGELTEGSALLYAVSRTTGIPSSFLHNNAVHSASVSMRMSWAAKRRTSRPEDIAYCLLGIFNVNMPLLYGEGGEKAFVRLQEEIIKVNHDQTILAWERETQSDPLTTDRENIGIFATSPADFQHSGNLVPQPRGSSFDLKPFEITNIGLRIHLPFRQGEEDDTFLGILDCCDFHDQEKRVALRFGLSNTFWSHELPERGFLLQILSLMTGTWWVGKCEKDIQLSPIPRLYHDYNIGPIKSGMTLFRQSGPLLFVGHNRFHAEPSTSFRTHEPKTSIFFGGHQSNYTRSEVIIGRPPQPRPRINQIIFRFPPGFTCTVLRPCHPCLEVLIDSLDRDFKVVVNDHEPQNMGRKDLFFSLKQDMDSSWKRFIWKLFPSENFVASLHWKSTESSYQLFMTPGPFNGDESTCQDLYISRKRSARAELEFLCNMYMSYSFDGGPPSPQSLGIVIARMPSFMTSPSMVYNFEWFGLILFLMSFPLYFWEGGWEVFLLVFLILFISFYVTQARSPFMRHFMTQMLSFLCFVSTRELVLSKNST